MKNLDIGRYSLSSCVAAALLAGCGASQAPIGGPAAMPQSRVVSTRAGRGGSWMLPEAKGDDLLYAGNTVSEVNVFSYPAGKLVGTLDEAAYGMCSDKKGDVFLTEPGGSESEILEYAHGGTKPIQTLDDGNAVPVACSVDPTTGNLAVINFSTAILQGPGDVAVYQDAEGTPELYSDSDIANFMSGSYDGSGNLLVDSAGDVVQFAELPKAGTALRNVTLNKYVPLAGTLQWDGTHFVVGQHVLSGKRKRSTLSVIEVTGSSGTVVERIQLKGLKVNFACLHGNVAIAAFGARLKQIGFWHYQEGGKPFEAFDGKIDLGFTGATVSLARR